MPGYQPRRHVYCSWAVEYIQVSFDSGACACRVAKPSKPVSPAEGLQLLARGLNTWVAMVHSPAQLMTSISSGVRERRHGAGLCRTRDTSLTVHSETDTGKPLQGMALVLPCTAGQTRRSPKVYAGHGRPMQNKTRRHCRVETKRESRSQSGAAKRNDAQGKRCSGSRSRCSTKRWAMQQVGSNTASGTKHERASPATKATAGFITYRGCE
jgi:hypothetical protein